MIERPMLAGEIKKESDFDKIKFPVLASPKLDGIRCLLHKDLGCVSRTFKPIPNQHIRMRLEDFINGIECGLDGELMTFNDEGEYDDFNTVQSKVMSSEGTPNFVYLVFDSFGASDEDGDLEDRPFHFRHQNAQNCCASIHTVEISSVNHVEIKSKEELIEYFNNCMTLGYEGCMLRDIHGVYKSGRSTLREGGLIKYKGDRADGEGVIVDWEEQMHNANEVVDNPFGLKKRSTHKANKTGKGILGAWIIRTKEFGLLKVGTGMTDDERARFWKEKEAMRDRGDQVLYEYQRSGMKDKPRFPVYKAILQPDVKGVPEKRKKK